MKVENKINKPLGILLDLKVQNLNGNLKNDELILKKDKSFLKIKLII